jgi:SAM-dependent methyltransferase
LRIVTPQEEQNKINDSWVIEIGGNDGTLLKNFMGHAQVLNIEPSRSVAVASYEAGVPTLCAPFGRKLLEHYHVPQADLIIANNVFAHDPNPAGLALAMSKVLKPGGTITIEFPWVANLIHANQFDTIYHEHYSYLGLRALVKIFADVGLFISDIDELDTHGGSLRVYITARDQIDMDYHISGWNFEDRASCYKFAQDAYRARTRWKSWYANNYSAGIYAYGAAAKGNTFLNFCGGMSGIEAVGDTTPAKIGKFLPGSRIPIISEDELLARKPGYILLLAWNWKDEIIPKLRSKGYTGKFVTAIPQLEIIE